MLIEAEGWARQIVEASRYEPHEDPFRIVHRLGLRVMTARISVQPTVMGRTVIVDRATRPVKQRFDAVHEAIHVVLRARGAADPEPLVNAITAATLCPREPFLVALRRHGWAPERLASVFPYVSQETLARRIVSLRPAILWVQDVAPQRRLYPVVSGEFRWPFRRPTTLERQAMDEALTDRRLVEPVPGVRAWPVLDPPYVRVLCLSDCESLLAAERIYGDGVRSTNRLCAASH